MPSFMKFRALAVLSGAIMVLQLLVLGVVQAPQAPMPLVLLIGASVGLALLAGVLLRGRAVATSEQRAPRAALPAMVQARFDDWSLTPGERVVARYAMQGLSEAEIAARCLYNEQDVQARMNGVLRKAGVPSRAQLIARAFGPETL